MDSTMSQQESYADRRKLFKNIWDTAINIDEKDTDDVVTKPKVIKTLRLDEVDRCIVGKRKKQRLKNLRAVCNKILDFCDRQDADDLYYEQMAAEGKDVQLPEPANQIKKPKTKAKRKIKSKSVFLRVAKPYTPRATTSERQGDYDRSENAPHSPYKKQSYTFKTKFSDHHRLETFNNPDGVQLNLKKNYNKKGKMKCCVAVTRAIPKPSKKLLQIHKINIS